MLNHNCLNLSLDYSGVVTKINKKKKNLKPCNVLQSVQTVIARVRRARTKAAPLAAATNTGHSVAAGPARWWFSK